MSSKFTAPTDKPPHTSNVDPAKLPRIVTQIHNPTFQEYMVLGSDSKWIYAQQPNTREIFCSYDACNEFGVPPKLNKPAESI